MEYYPPVKENEIMPFAATWMDLEIVILSEVSQTDKDKYCRISLKCGIQKKWYRWTYLQNRNRVTDVLVYRKQSYGYQGGKRGKDKLGDWDWHIHTTIYKTDN